MKATLLEQCNQLPPRVCRALARHPNGRPKTTDEIAMEVNRSNWWVLDASRSETWDRFTVADAQAFAAACGVDLLRPRRTLDYIKRGKFAHVRDCREREYLLRLMKGESNDKRHSR